MWRLTLTCLVERLSAVLYHATARTCQKRSFIAMNVGPLSVSLLWPDAPTSRRLLSDLFETHLRWVRGVQLTNLLETIITDARGGMHVSQRLAAAVQEAQQALRRTQDM